MSRSWWLRFLWMAAGMVFARFEQTVGLGIVVLAGCIGMGMEKKLRRDIGVLGLCLLLGWGWYSWRIPDIPDFLQETEAISLRGEVTDYKQQPEKTTWVLQTDSPFWWLHRVLIQTNQEITLNAGDVIELGGTLRLPREPRNPGEFHYRRYLADARIYYILTVPDTENIQILEENQGFSLSKWRSQRIRQVELQLGSEMAGILLGMVLGSKELIADETYAAFQQTGTVHLLAVSGLHVGFVLLLSEGLFLGLKISRGKKRLLQMLLLLGYGCLTGWAVPIRRAVSMTGLGFLAEHWGRTRSPLDILGLSGIGIILCSPTDLFSVSFRLSFAAVWGIFCLLPYLQKVCPWKNRGIQLFLLPVAVELSIFPLSMYDFQMCSLSSLFINVVAVWIGAGIVWLGLPGFLFLPLLLYPASILVKLLTRLVEMVSRWEGSYFHTVQPSVGLVLLFYLLLGMIVAGDSIPTVWRTSVRRSCVLAVFGVGILLFLPHTGAGGTLRLTFLDVGQGSCTLVQTPGGKYGMIDGGGSKFYDVGNRLVVPWLYRQGIRELEWMVNTHPDTDHLQGLAAAAAAIRVKNLILPDGFQSDEVYQPLIQDVQQQGGKLWYVAAGEKWHPEAGLELEIWNPASASSNGKREAAGKNEDSLVFCLQTQDFSYLVTGDTGRDTLMEILRRNATHPITLLQVPHHGSRNSYCPEFYKAVHPEWAIIQSGKGNVYGHPHSEVVEALQNQGIYVLRTDESGCITVEVAQDGVHIEKFIQKSK